MGKTACIPSKLGGVFIFFIFTPIWGRFPFWLIFFKGVETTNWVSFCYKKSPHVSNVRHIDLHQDTWQKRINSTLLTKIFRFTPPKTNMEPNMKFWKMNPLFKGMISGSMLFFGGVSLCFFQQWHLQIQLRAEGLRYIFAWSLYQYQWSPGSCSCLLWELNPTQVLLAWERIAPRYTSLVGCRCGVQVTLLGFKSSHKFKTMCWWQEFIVPHLQTDESSVDIPGASRPYQL